MKKIKIAFLIFLTLAFLLSLLAEGSPSCQHTTERFNCVKYVKNYDGDTITFNIPDVHPIIGKKISIRVNGIDTAEVRTKDECEKKAGRTARKLVTNLLKNAKRIDLDNVSRGKYFRIVADVIVDGRDLKSILLKQQLAYSYNGGKKERPNWCQLRRLPANQ